MGILIFVLLLSLIGCGEITTSSSDEVHLDVDAQFVKFNDIAHIADVIIIDDSCLLGDVIKIETSPRGIYLIDRQTQSVNLLSDSGKIVNVFNRVGRGRLEYVQILDLTVVYDTVYLLCEPSKIIKISGDLKVAYEERRLIKPYKRITYWDDKILLYNSEENNVDTFEWDKATYSAVLIGQKTNFNGVFYPQSVFHKTAEELFVCMNDDPIIYRICRNSVEFEHWKTLTYKNIKRDIRKLQKSSNDGVSQMMRYQLPHVLNIVKTYDERYVILCSFKGMYHIVEIGAETYSDYRISHLLGSAIPELNHNGFMSSYAMFYEENEDARTRYHLDKYYISKSLKYNSFMQMLCVFDFVR